MINKEYKVIFAVDEFEEFIILLKADIELRTILGGEIYLNNIIENKEEELPKELGIYKANLETISVNSVNLINSEEQQEEQEYSFRLKDIVPLYKQDKKMEEWYKNAEEFEVKRHEELLNNIK